jgi:hypothetical protein
VAAKEAYRRKFAGLFERALADDGFVRSGRTFVYADATGNQILIELQSGLNLGGDCVNFYINGAVLLGIKIETQRRHITNPAWQPTTGSGVWDSRLSPGGWDPSYVWKLCSLDDAVREAQRAGDSLRRELPRLKSLMDPEVMLATSKTERWPMRLVVEGYLLAAQGRVDDVEELLGTRGKDPSDLIQFEREILDAARMRAAYQ